MNECGSCKENDLTGSRWSVLLWWLPWLLILAGCFTGNALRTALWTAGFAVSGTACIANARRCGRLHCFYTGPLYLLAALASLLYGLRILPLGLNGWGWILGAAVGGSLFTQTLLEKWLGKYTAS